MTKEEYEKVSKAVWDGLSKLNGHGRGYSRDAWRETVVSPHGVIMGKIKQDLQIED